MSTGGSDKWLATRLINAYAVRTLGNDVMTKAANGEIPYTDEGLVAAADKLASWAEKGYFGEGVTTVDASTAQSMLMNGQAAIFYTGSWFTQNLTDPTQNTAGEDGIGFFNIPVEDESISSSTSYSMNCGNILAMSKDKMNAEVSSIAQENVQPLLNGDMTGQEYMQSIQDAYDMSN